jgi:hypothetical protein
MSVRKIYVNPGDLIIIHVIDDPELPKNNKEWYYSKPHPFKIACSMGKSNITFHDPGAEIFMQQGNITIKKRIY